MELALLEYTFISVRSGLNLYDLVHLAISGHIMSNKKCIYERIFGKRGIGLKKLSYDENKPSCSPSSHYILVSTDYS